ncbi:hypothetical protein K0M31_002976 [Melipona bicolor]|uniref:Uncharacterized protein n=1 Tax=Melipona bicolor TaxID=60889 RepID=A0AA40KQ07_9HYME|nr:hypothetical protein K0M31_002976 [Melipona bicolor]
MKKRAVTHVTMMFMTEKDACKITANSEVVERLDLTSSNDNNHYKLQRRTNKENLDLKL